MKVGQSAIFRCYDGTLIHGVVTAILGRCLRVHCLDHYCGVYQDGLFRFTERNIVG